MNFCVRVIGMLVLLVGLLPAQKAAAQVRDVRRFERDMTLEQKGEALLASFSFDEVFTDRFRRRLSSGFTSRLVVKVVLANKKGKKVALGLIQYTILYDIWEERFRVRIRGTQGRRDLQVGSMNDLLKACSQVSGLPLIFDLGLDAKELYRLQVDIEVNPASEEQRRKVREYLANPDGRSTVGSPSSFFGSFSRIFVREKDIQADAIYTYRSPLRALPAAQDR